MFVCCADVIFNEVYIFFSSTRRRSKKKARNRQSPSDLYDYLNPLSGDNSYATVSSQMSESPSIYYIDPLTQKRLDDTFRRNSEDVVKLHDIVGRDKADLYYADGYLKPIHRDVYWEVNLSENPRICDCVTMNTQNNNYISFLPT